MIEKYSPQDIAAALQKVGAKVYQPTDEQSAIISIAANPLEPAVVIAGAGSTMTGSSGTVFKMADGSDCSPKTPIYLNDLVRSWNRP